MRISDCYSCPMYESAVCVGHTVGQRQPSIVSNLRAFDRRREPHFPPRPCHEPILLTLPSFHIPYSPPSSSLILISHLSSLIMISLDFLTDSCLQRILAVLIQPAGPSDFPFWLLSQRSRIVLYDKCSSAVLAA